MICFLLQNTMCTSFAATGRPNHPAFENLNWEPVSRLAPFKCLNISKQLSVVDLPHTMRLQFWNTMYDFVNTKIVDNSTRTSDC